MMNVQEEYTAVKYVLYNDDGTVAGGVNTLAQVAAFEAYKMHTALAEKLYYEVFPPNLEQ